ncbi:adenosine deaminase-2 [Acrodontium crateriforme]|uniref:Adenosine deaminase-2 n=1 Tax=Acrodontium crateriforme TaxID=150365 RepID=A0AAQ3M943_9PEZI|nr:adenosine deaminase-2 [Acrodontium crateriforme]
MPIGEAISLDARKKLRASLLASNDKFIQDIPKVELHVHIEGTLTLDLRWKLTQRNGATLRLVPNGPEITARDDLYAAMDSIMPDASRMNNEEERDMFFESYLEGFNALQVKEDFYDLAMNYFETVAAMNVRYCEPFFDPQGHTSRGVQLETMMEGFRQAQREAKEKFNVRSQWIMCFLRDLSPASAMEHYKAALPYRDMIVGIGLDSCEPGRPPSLFEDVFALARRDGFKLTAHCDVDQEDTDDHILQVASTMGVGGSDRIDHGLNSAEDPALIDLLLKRDIGMTLCPWSYMRHTTYADLGPRIRTLFDAGVKVCMNSDDPAFMEDTWILHNVLLARHLCNFNDEDIVVLAKNAVQVSWADQSVKDAILGEIKSVFELLAGNSKENS